MDQLNITHRQKSAKVAGVYSGYHLDASVVRCLRYVPLGRGPDEDPGPADGTVALSWLGNSTPSPWQSWRKCQGRGKSWHPSSDCYPCYPATDKHRQLNWIFCSVALCVPRKASVSWGTTGQNGTVPLLHWSSSEVYVLCASCGAAHSGVPTGIHSRSQTVSTMRHTEIDGR